MSDSRESQATDTRALVESRRRPPGLEARRRILVDLPVRERHIDAGGLSTAVLEGGEGPPVVLLHGPGEHALKWFRVIPDLAKTHRVVAPDLPGHGATEAADVGIQGVLRWLEDVIRETCPSPPVLVGQILGGAIAARFAIDHGHRLAGLVLADSLGLAPFRPTPEFGSALHRFLSDPTEETHEGLWQQCAFDLDALRDALGPQWKRLETYNLDRAVRPELREAQGKLMEQFGFPAIPDADLARISVPTTLIWGRHDLATPLEIAEEARDRRGWRLVVIDGAADDPPIECPEAFLGALRATIGGASYRNFTGNGAENYQRYFVPAIAMPASRDLLRVAALEPGDRVLDVACGTGVIARLAAERVGPGGSVTAVDISAEMIEVAATVPSTGARIEWRVGDATALELADGTYDVVLCQMGLMFLDEPAGAIAEMRRVLVPGGRLVVNTPGTIQPPFRLMAEALAEHIAPELGGFVRAVFSMPEPDAVGALLSASGLQEVSATESTARLRLPSPAEFLWQYIHLTPMGPMVDQAPEAAKVALERQIVDSWQPYVVDGRVPLDQPMVTATGRR